MAGRGFQGVAIAGFVAVGRAIGVAIGVGYAASADARLGFVGVAIAGLFAIQAAVGVAVVVRGAAAADAGLGFVGVGGAGLFAIQAAIAVAVIVGGATATDARVDLAGVLWATVQVVDGFVVIAIDFAGVAQAVTVAIDLIFVVDELTVVIIVQMGVVIVVVVARIACLIPVVVFLIGVEVVDAVIEEIRDAVAIAVGCGLLGGLAGSKAARGRQDQDNRNPEREEAGTNRFGHEELLRGQVVRLVEMRGALRWAISEKDRFCRPFINGSEIRELQYEIDKNRPKSGICLT